jgi:hypothetical protein
MLELFSEFINHQSVADVVVKNYANTVKLHGL